MLGRLTQRLNGLRSEVITTVHLGKLRTALQGVESSLISVWKVLQKLLKRTNTFGKVLMALSIFHFFLVFTFFKTWLCGNG